METLPVDPTSPKRPSRSRRWIFAFSLILNAIFVFGGGAIFLMGPPSADQMPTESSDVIAHEEEPTPPPPTVPFSDSTTDSTQASTADGRAGGRTDATPGVMADTVDGSRAVASAEPSDTPVLTETSFSVTIAAKIADHLPFATSSLGRPYSFSDLPTLRWSPVTGAKDYVVEWSANTDFSNSESLDAVTATELHLPFAKPGRSFWRVRARNAHDEAGFPSRAAELTVLFAPVQVAKVGDIKEMYASPADLKKGSHTFLLTWPSSSYADHYELRWSDANDANHVKYFLTKHNTFRITVHESRHFKAEVRVINHNDDVLTAYSSPREVVFEKDIAHGYVKAGPTPIDVRILPESEAVRRPAAIAQALHSSIHLERPAPNSPMVFLENKPLKIEFEWDALLHAEEYEVQWSTDADFTSVVATRKLAKTKIVYSKDFHEGKIFWRVRGRIERQWSAWSESSDFEVIYE